MEFQRFGIVLCSRKNERIFYFYRIITSTADWWMYLVYAILLLLTTDYGIAIKAITYGSVAYFFHYPIYYIIKNTTKQIEDEIFTVKENIRVLKSELENVSLEYDYLSSAEQLLEFQSLYFENELIKKDIKNIKIYYMSNDQDKIEDFKINKE